MKKGRMEGGTVRHLDELVEVDPNPRASKLGALAVASLGGACIVFASILLFKGGPKKPDASVDPLGALVEKAKTAPAVEAEPLGVSFPKTLSDGENPTTALELVRDRKAIQDSEFQLEPGAPTAPPPATDRLPLMPLPARDLVARAGREATPGQSDTLYAMAKQASRETGNEVEMGTPGGFQLQVSSFPVGIEAEAFAKALRRRGHRAYVEAAHVKDKGLWHRVRVGPFKYKRSAEIYRQEFEAKERLVTFIVSPPKTRVEVRPSKDDTSDE